MITIINAASDRHYQQMLKLAEFVGADILEYKDLGNGEDYKMTKDGKRLTLEVRANKPDGGFLCIPEAFPPEAVNISMEDNPR